MKRNVSAPLAALLTLLFIGFLFSCKKSKTTTPVVLTPLQSYINTDSTLSLFHQMVIEGNDEVLLNDSSIVFLIPTNTALRAAGYTSDSISAMSSTYADRMIRYQYVETSQLDASTTDSSYPTALNIPLFARKYGTNQLIFNEAATSADTFSTVGKASVYRLNSLIPSTADSVPEILENDTSLTFLYAAYTRTGFYDSVLLTGQYSVLLPDNNAFRAIGYDTVTLVDSIDYDSLVQLLGNQVIKGMYFTGSFPASAATMTGTSVVITPVNGFVQFAGPGNTVPVNWLNGNLVTGSNLVVHYTDGFISP